MATHLETGRGRGRGGMRGQHDGDAGHASESPDGLLRRLPDRLQSPRGLRRVGFDHETDPSGRIDMQGPDHVM